VKLLLKKKITFEKVEKEKKKVLTKTSKEKRQNTKTQ
jgi:hypothetical protein